MSQKNDPDNPTMPRLLPDDPFGLDELPMVWN